MEADDIIAALGLAPHPEGGWYRQTWVANHPPGARPTGTSILFLLGPGERSHWHRVDADEIWHFHSGAPIRLSVSSDTGGPAADRLLGPDVTLNQSPQVVIPAGHWQSARSTGGWSLAGCTVSPGFRFEGFELAPADFEIPYASEDVDGALSRHFPDRRRDWFAPMRIGASPPSADEGARLILSGLKTATSSLPWEFTDGRLPFVRALSVVLDGQDRARAIVETVHVKEMRLSDADETLARCYGEGDRTLDWWRREIGSYYLGAGAAKGVTGDDPRLVVEHFRVVRVLGQSEY